MSADPTSDWFNYDVGSSAGVDPFAPGPVSTVDPGSFQTPWPTYDVQTGTPTDPTGGGGPAPPGQPNWNITGPQGGSGSILQSLLQAAGGIYGLSQGRNVSGMAQAAFNQSNPFGQYRGLYGGQLMNLMANPGSITQDPGYQFAFGQGQQAVDRSMAAKGFLGSGNEAIALQQYGEGFANDYLHQQEQFLAGLAGSGIAPNFGASLSGAAGGADIQSGALNSLLYGGPGSVWSSVLAGGAGAGTPAAGGATRPSAAGGEAAALAGQAGQALGIAGAGTNIAKWAGANIPSAWSTGIGGASDILGIYTGLQRGGFTGYTQAGADAVQLAGLAGYSTGALGAAAGVVGPALSLYNFAENWQSGATGSDTISGAEAGASIGTAIVPGIGTIIGGVLGGAVGAISSAFGPGEADPESGTFGGYVTAYGKGGPQAVAGATPAQTFQSLAGLFDLRSGQIGGNIPMYQQYGRMGENQFTADMLNQINSAISSGKVSASATPQQLYDSVVTPWMNSWGKGAMSDPNAGAISNMVQQIIGQWKGGQLTANTPVGVDGQKVAVPAFQGTNLPTLPAPQPAAGPAANPRLVGVPTQRNIGYVNRGIGG